MSKLKMWTDGCYFVIAATKADAMTIIVEDVDGEAEEDEWYPWPDEKPFTLHEDDGSKTTKPAAEWWAIAGPITFGGI